MAADSRDDATTQLGEVVSRLSRRLRHASARRLEPLGLSVGQARVLRLVGREGEPLRMSAIAKRIGVVPRSATTFVEGLEAKGLVAREIDLNDRRSILVRPTPSGSCLLAELGEARDEAARALFGSLGAKDRAVLLRLLSSVERATEREDKGDR